MIFQENFKYRFKYFRNGATWGFTGKYIGVNISGFLLFEKGSKRRIFAISPASIHGDIYQCAGFLKK